MRGSSTHLAAALPWHKACRKGISRRAVGEDGPQSAWPKRAVVPEHTSKPSEPKPISLLGSTGSIGRQTLEICSEHPDAFTVVALSAGSNVKLLSEQIRKFKPKLVGLQDARRVTELKALIKDVSPQPEIMAGSDSAEEAARHSDVEAVVAGIVGCAGLRPTVAAVEAGKDICLANKETLVAGGSYVVPLADQYGVKILPIDSEHSAIFQCIQGDISRTIQAWQRICSGLPEGGFRRLILTASGGVFRDWPVERLKDAKIADTLKHPTWTMGQKITIDSATSVNKGLEVIEAHYLFGVDYDDIEVVIHPQSIIHSMVETADSSVLAQLGWPDIRMPILYAMSWPRRIFTSEEMWPRLDFANLSDLTFQIPDRRKYPALDLAYAAGRAGGTMTGVFNAANEKAVELFLGEKVAYLDIVHLIESTCEQHKKELNLKPDLEEIVHFDRWARDYVGEIFQKEEQLMV